MGKDWKSCKLGELAILSHSEPLRWEKIGKVANQVKLAIPSHSEPLQWEKIGKVANQAKLAFPSHSEPLWWEKIGKVANQAKWPFRIILRYFGRKDWKSCESGKIGHSKSKKLLIGAKLAIPSHSGPFDGKRLEKLQNGQIGHSESF